MTMIARVVVLVGPGSEAIRQHRAGPTQPEADPPSRLSEVGDPKSRQLEPARRLAASGRPSATSCVIAVGTLRPYYIWC